MGNTPRARNSAPTLTKPPLPTLAALLATSTSTAPPSRTAPYLGLASVSSSSLPSTSSGSASPTPTTARSVPPPSSSPQAPTLCRLPCFPASSAVLSASLPPLPTSPWLSATATPPAAATAASSSTLVTLTGPSPPPSFSSRSSSTSTSRPTRNGSSMPWTSS